jgi:hypothetical protein
MAAATEGGVRDVAAGDEQLIVICSFWPADAEALLGLYDELEVMTGEGCRPPP